tara:strand:- start:2268 stop:3212 length:945 start_codon:yes stop_codon:yes gene_type:complete
MAYNANAVISGGLNGEGTRAGESFATEIWGPAVETAIKEKLVLTNLCNDLSPLVATQGERIHLPKIDQVTAGTKSEGAITWETSSSDAGEEVLNVDTHKYAAALIEDVVQVQGNYDLLNMFAKELGYSIANAVDTAIDTAIIDSLKASGGLNAATEIDISGTPMGTEADFDVIATSCYAQDPDPNNWTIVLSPGVYANLMNIADLSLATQGAALGSQFTQTGVVAKAFGFNVMMSQNVTTATTDMDSAGGTDNKAPHGYVLHKSACHIAFSQKARLQSQYDVDYLGTKVIADTIFGILVRYGTAAGQVRSFLLT